MSVAIKKNRKAIIILFEGSKLCFYQKEFLSPRQLTSSNFYHITFLKET